jgi:hypothetical protein
LRKRHIDIDMTSIYGVRESLREKDGHRDVSSAIEIDSRKQPLTQIQKRKLVHSFVKSDHFLNKRSKETFLRNIFNRNYN